jgi:hypothetical protein
MWSLFLTVTDFRATRTKISIIPKTHTAIALCRFLVRRHSLFVLKAVRMGRAAALWAACLLLLLSRLSGRIDSPGVGDWLKQLADQVEGSYEDQMAGKSAKYLEERLSGVDMDISGDAPSPGFLEKAKLAAVLSAEAYRLKSKGDASGRSQRVLSRDDAGKPDCFARLVPKTRGGGRATLWIVVRGTATRR